MNRKNICEICTLIMGQSPDSKSYNKDKNGIPFYQGNADFGEEHPTPTVWCTAPKKIARKGDILISVRAPIGDMNIANEDCCIGRGLAAIRLNKSDIVDINYLYHYLSATVEFLQEQGTGSTFKAINKTTLEGIEIPCPSIEKQKNIAKLIIEIKTSIQYKKAELVALNELVKSRFIEMFGDPLSNSKGYDLSDYGSLFELNAGGTPSKNKPEYWENGNISWIGSNMCQDTILYENDGKYITELGFNNSSARMFPKNTVLVALVGATIGKTALLKFETTTNQNVLGIRGIEESGNNPYFVFYYTQGLHKFFMDISDGGFAMASKGFISKLPFPIVDISLQNEFATFVKQIDKSKVDNQIYLINLCISNVLTEDLFSEQ